MVKVLDRIRTFEGVYRRYGITISPAIQAGDVVYFSGMTAVDLETGQPVAGGIEAQARYTLGVLERVLDEIDLNLDHVIKVTAFLANPVEDFMTWNEVFLETFRAPYPCRATVGAALFVCDIELEIIAGLQPRVRQG